MDIVVKGRNVEVPDHFRTFVTEKLQKLERYDHKLIEVDVELLHERNPRQMETRQRVEITCVSRGPVVRAEASAADFYTALDRALDKINTRLRRAADRRRVHRGRRTPVSVAAATAELAGSLPAGLEAGPDAAELAAAKLAGTELQGTELEGTELEGTGLEGTGLGVTEPEDEQPWHIARTKEHPAEPMTVDDALFRMELVGHDFFLFLDKDSGRPSVVYRRKGYDYGVISLAPLAEPEPTKPEPELAG